VDDAGVRDGCINKFGGVHKTSDSLGVHHIKATSSGGVFSISA